MKKHRLRSTSIALKIIGSCILYYIAGKIGLELATINDQTSPVWPASGVAISLLYAFGPWVSLGVFAGAFLTNWFTGLGLQPTAMIATGNMIEAAMAVYLFKRLQEQNVSFGSHGRLVFAMVSMLASTAVGATIGTLTLYVFSIVETGELYRNWLTWWTGDSLGALFIVPFTYKIVQGDFKIFDLKKIQILQLGAILFLSLFFNKFVFRTEAGEPYSFLLLLPLLLTSCLFSSGWVYIVSFLICVNSIINTTLGYGPFVGNSTNESLIHLQLFLASLGFTAVGIGSLKNEGFYRRSAIALLVGWVLSGLAFQSFYNQGLEKDRDFFERSANEARDAILQKLSTYETLLESGASFFDASEGVTEDDWKEFTSRAIQSEAFRGVNGIGVIFSAKSKKPVSFRTEAGLKELPKLFSIHDVPVTNMSSRTQNPDSHLVITYIEPIERNIEALGLDVATEVNRHEAARRARDSGSFALTNPIQLVQDKILRPGHLLYFPIFWRKSALATAEERRKTLRGFIYIPIIAHDFFNSILEKRPSMHLDVRLKHPTESYRSLFIAEPLPGPTKHQMTQDISLAGLELSLSWSMGPVPGSTTALLASWLGFSGAMCSIFLAILLGSLENLTARAQKIATEKTAEAEERRRLWQALTETSPVGIFLTDPSGHFTYVNPTWSEITGIKLPDALGRGWINAVQLEDRKTVEENWEQLFSTGKFRCHYRYLKENQTVMYVEGQAVPMRNESGTVTGYVGTLQDVTDLQKKQEALVATARLSSLGEMASGIAHEINNPLAIIIGKARLIEKGDYIDEKLTAQTQLIIKTAKRISKIIKGLQAFARETSNEPFESVRVSDVIQNTLELCRERFAKHQTDLIVPDRIEENLKVWGREEQLSQVIMNLLSNAFDAAQESPTKWVRIEAETTDSNSSIRITVEDSGCGISSKDEERIFNPFYTTKEVGKGTGLGLSISKGIVEKHRGRLYLDRTSKNTKFVVELTRYQDAEPQLS